MKTISERIADVITRQAKRAPMSTNPFDGSRSFAPSVEEVARAVFIEVVEPELVRADRITESPEWAHAALSPTTAAENLMRRLYSALGILRSEGLRDPRRLTLRAHPTTLAMALENQEFASTSNFDSVLGFPLVLDDTMPLGDMTLRYEVAV